MDIKDHLRKSLAQKYLWKQAIGVLAINLLKKEFPNKHIDWYIKFDKLFVWTNDLQTQISIHNQQPQLLKLINQKLSTIWYKTQINKIYVKIHNTYTDDQILS